MLQAGSSCAREWAMPNFPEQISNTTTVRRKVNKTNLKRKLCFRIAAIVFGYAFLLVFLCIKSATLGYQIEKLQGDIQDLSTNNQRIEYQIAEQSSLSRVEKIAETELGMIKPDDKSTIAMKTLKEPVQVASTPIAGEKANVSQQIWQKMFNSFARLAQK